MLKRLRLKFVCVNMIIVTVMIGVILGLVLRFTQLNMEQQSVSMMQSIALDQTRPGRPDEPGAEVRLPYFVLQIDRRGEVTAVGGGYYDLSDTAFLQEIVNTALDSKKQVGVISEYDLRFYRMVAPDIQRIVFADISAERTTLRSLWQHCLVIAGVGFLAFLVISLLLSRWAVKPVDRAWKQQKRFVADASHELKTPLTVIMTNAELLRAPEHDAGEKETFADNILAESRQMRGLVESLLELARVDTGETGLVFSQVDLSRVVEQAVLPFEPVFFEQGLILETELAPGITVKGSESRLRQLTAILLDNAQKYSQAGGRTTVTLARQRRGRCLLSVADQGEPIPAAEREHIFKRFYRMDQARTRNHSYGLGLSIAQSIVETHHGRIWVESKNGVNTFSVSLPCLP